MTKRERERAAVSQGYPGMMPDVHMDPGYGGGLSLQQMNELKRAHPTAMGGPKSKKKKARAPSGRRCRVP